MTVHLIIRALRTAALLALSAVLPLSAQVTSGSITGYVWDPANRAIAGAKVTASDSLRSTVREAATDSKGLYYFADLPPAAYTVDCSVLNFATAEARIEGIFTCRSPPGGRRSRWRGLCMRSKANRGSWAR